MFRQGDGTKFGDKPKEQEEDDSKTYAIAEYDTKQMEEIKQEMRQFASQMM